MEGGSATRGLRVCLISSFWDTSRSGSVELKYTPRRKEILMLESIIGSPDLRRSWKLGGDILRAGGGMMEDRNVETLLGAERLCYHIDDGRKL